MLKKILVAVDGSDSSERAVDMASEMAGTFDASLLLLHVVRHMPVPHGLRHMAEVEHIDASRSDLLKMLGTQILDKARTQAAQAGVKHIETDVGVGDPANTIIQYAEDNQADLIVMGTRGLGQVEGMLLGSVSRKVSNLSGVNCLTVR